MADAVTVYKWDDVGAPQIVDGKPSEYMNVLKKCLVDGYGAKTPAGWSVAQEDAITPYLALRNNTASGGSGGVFEMSLVTDDAAGSKIEITAFADFINRDSKSRGVQKSRVDRYSSGDYLLKNWIVFATSKAFILWITMPFRTTHPSHGTYEHVSIWCGDVASFYNNDPATFTLISSKGDTTNQSWNNNFAYNVMDTINSNVVLYALDGSTQNSAHSFVSAISQQGAVLSSSFSGKNDEPEIDLLAEIYVIAGSTQGVAANAQYINNQAMPRVRATLPGVFVAGQGGYMLQNMPFFKVINGQQHFLLPHSNGDVSLVWINCEEW